MRGTERLKLVNSGVNSLFDRIATKVIKTYAAHVVMVAILSLGAVFAQAVPQQAPAAAPQGKAVGEIKSISGRSLMLATDDGKTESVSLPEEVRVVRIAPGATDLKNATPITRARFAGGRSGAGARQGFRRRQIDDRSPRSS